MRHKRQVVPALRFQRRVSHSTCSGRVFTPQLEAEAFVRDVLQATRRCIVPVFAELSRRTQSPGRQPWPLYFAGDGASPEFREYRRLRGLRPWGSPVPFLVQCG